MAYHSDDFIGIDISGVPEIIKRIEQLPEAVADEVVEAIDEYLINVFRLYPPQKYVSRKQAYGVAFFTDKQRRWFFWALKNNMINTPYERTQTLANGWKTIGTGFNQIVVNQTPYADIVMGEHQSRMSALIGWKQIDQIVSDRMGRIMEIANGATKKAIRRLRLG